ncbi:nitrogen regulation protein NR(II) [Pseudovibrio sp. JE062]|uniref:two-component system sensor histidine kinase NtrB n=1 Tax=Pseudovibrio sp. JE062 TaxID=439495 RepID=UPI0006812C26|nr:nitrogen regulation protein NR(II) [Pseudovibrio sp. JE062]
MLETGGDTLTHAKASLSSGVPGQAVLDSLPHPVVVVGGDDKIVGANSAAEGFFHASLSVMKRREVSWFVPFGSPLLGLIAQVRDRGGPVNEYKVDIGSPRIGQEKLVDIHASPLSDAPGSVVLLFQERTMAEKLDKQLTSRGAARTVTGLAAMLAHEIKNPLSGIRGAAQLLEQSASEDDRSLTRLIMEETDRIVKLVDRMEVFSDERPIDREPVNIHVVLDHVKRVAENGFASKVRIVEDYDPSLPPVYANRDQLVQVFINLIKNASEALSGANEPEIVVSTAFRPGVRLSVPGVQERVSLPLEFCVRDNGYGVPEDLRPHLFDPFITTKTNGSGLGLALVAKIVGDHGGVVECESGTRGTTFRILMPAFTGPDVNSGIED